MDWKEMIKEMPVKELNNILIHILTEKCWPEEKKKYDFCEED